MTTHTKPTFTVVIETADWRIERDRAAGDFNAYVVGAGYIGSRPTQRAAQALIDQYWYSTASRAPEQLVSVEEGDGPGGIDLYAAAFKEDDDDYADAPIFGGCTICDCAAWDRAPNGDPLCPDHFGILQELAA